jgi:hypothetical protein
MLVGIIGSGQSGLVTCKTFIEKNIDVIVFEKNRYNGLFYKIKEKKYFTWSSSKYISGFTDFPIPKNYPTWMNINNYTNYLDEYKNKFDLDKYIKYNTEVIKCVETDNNKWKIFYKINNKLYVKIVDKLIVCTGLNSVPKYPKLKNYTGDIYHGDEIYKMTKNEWKNKFSNKKILVLGGGESALDIGHMITNYTDKIYYSTKNYIEWFPDWGLDKNKYKNCSKKFPFVFQSKYPSDTMLSYLEYALPTPMSGFWHKYGRFFLSQSKCVHLYFFDKKKSKLCDINKTPQPLFNKYVVKRTPFMCDIYENKVNVIYYPKKYDGKDVITKEEYIKNVDIIICCTGYKKEFKFLDKKYYTCKLIKKIVSSKNHNLAYIGFARPTMGSLNNIAEMQSWWTYMFFF